MISMHGVPSVLIAKNQSWVRKQAQALIRHLPANVERADLIQVGLIAVAQAAVTFQWEGDRDTEEAQEAFVRYARMRVKGAMLDELRQMDFLTRGERRKIKVIQIARERFRSSRGLEPNYTQLSELTGLEPDEIGALLQADQLGRHQASVDDDDGEHMLRHHPATPQEEVEARVDTGIVLRRLEHFFAELPERERMVIDAYLGIGLTPVEVAKSLKVTPSRVSQIYHSVVRRVATHFGHGPAPAQRAIDRRPATSGPAFDDLMRQREADLAADGHPAWSEMMEQVLSLRRGQQGEAAEPTAAALVQAASPQAPVEVVVPDPVVTSTTQVPRAEGVPALPAAITVRTVRRRRKAEPLPARVGQPEEELLQISSTTRWG